MTYLLTATTPAPGETPSTYIGNDTSPTPPSNFTPPITPCESPFVYKIYRHRHNDSLALHNMDTSLVGIYDWITMVGAEGPVVMREYRELTEVEFIAETGGIYEFVGWTIDSECVWPLYIGDIMWYNIVCFICDA